jgi:hypothetical protein
MSSNNSTPDSVCSQNGQFPSFCQNNDSTNLSHTPTSDCRQNSLSPQLREHHGPQPITPPPPSPQISAAELLQLTEASATNNGTFQCTLCNKQFGYKNGLIRHVRLTHVGEKPYQCSICNRRFGYKHILMEHQNLHFGNRPYACTLCDKRFAARSNLIQHRMVHRRPFNCTLCSKRFDREDQLKKHLFAHPQSQISVAGDGMISPQQCAKSNSDHVVGESGHGHVKCELKNLDEDVCAPFPGRPKDDRGQHYSLTLSKFPHESDCNASGVEVVVPPEVLHTEQITAASYHNVAVKKEVIDSTDSQSDKFDNSADVKHMSDIGKFFSDSRQHYAYVPKSFTLGHLAETSSVSHSQQWTSTLPRFTGTTILSPVLPDVTSKLQQVSPGAALPGIHEMFSRHANQKLPPFANFMPSTAEMFPSSDLQHSILLSALPPQLQKASDSFFSPSCASGSVVPAIVNPTQRPTAQLPPITQPIARSTKDQAVQHSQTVAGFPSLDDVLAYYVSQGRLFRCQHCSILFFERGMYFLHASLHGLASPWECSICHKVCSDKNEFTLHFVNQQHHP